MMTHLLTTFHRILSGDDNNDDYYIFDDSFVATSFESASLIFVIVSCLIAITIFFELVKDYAIESSTKFTRPIVITLLGEMTILGVISLCTFAISYGGTLEKLSSSLFGRSASDYVPSTVETCHYLLFLVMILTVVQVYLLLVLSNTVTRNYMVYNEISQDEDKIDSLLIEAEKIPDTSRFNWFLDYLTNPLDSWNKYSRRKEVESTLMFYALRREHLLKRNPLPPFNVLGADKALPVNFDYAAYQSHSMTKLLIKAVSFTPVMWIGLWVLAVLIYALMLAIDGIEIIFYVFWLLLGYLTTLGIYLMQLQLVFVTEHLINPKHLKRHLAKEKAASEKIVTEESPLLEKAAAVNAKYAHLLPQLTSKQKVVSRADMLVVTSSSPISLDHSSIIHRLKHIDADAPLYTQVQEIEEQSPLSYLLLGHVHPNRHEQLFWFDKLGPLLNENYFRLHLIITSLYFTIVLCFFVPTMFEDYGSLAGTVYLVLSILPLPIQFFVIYPELITVMAQTVSTGLLKDRLTEQEVLRDQKLQKVIQLLALLTKVNAAMAGSDEAALNQERKYFDSLDKSDPKIMATIEEIARIYRIYDKKGDGTVSHDATHKILKTLGLSLNEEEEDMVYTHLTHGTTHIELRDLTAWVLHSTHENNAREVAIEFLSNIEHDESGEVTTAKFCDALRRYNEPPFNCGIEDIDILSMARQFDSDGDGHVSIEEMESLLTQYFT